MRIRKVDTAINKLVAVLVSENDLDALFRVLLDDSDFSQFTPPLNGGLVARRVLLEGALAFLETLETLDTGKRRKTGDAAQPYKRRRFTVPTGNILESVQFLHLSIAVERPPTSSIFALLISSPSVLKSNFCTCGRRKLDLTLNPFLL